MKRIQQHKIVFILAGIYNIAWGAFSAINPQWLFRFSGLPDINHPQIFACLGMVIGVYGILYLEVARKPQRGFMIAAVGLLGKILGPAGWVYLYATGVWPLASIVLILANDLIWWIPFAIYLVDSKPGYFND